jgi:hypothetical protein
VIAFALVCAAAMAGCRGYDDSTVRGRLDEHGRRLAALEEATAELRARLARAR